MLNGTDLPSQANFEQKQFYWWSAFVVMWTGFGLTIAVIWEWQHNPSYSKPMFRGFIPVFLGNLCFIFAYLPYHTYNAFSSAIEGPDFNVAENDAICYLATFGGPALFNVYSWLGMTLVAYSLHETVRYSLKGDPGHQTITNSVVIASFLAPLVLALAYFYIDFDNVGSFRGLYCAWTNWNARNVAFGGVYWLVCASIMIFFYYNTYKMLHGHFRVMEVSGGLKEQGAKTVNNMISLSIKMTFAFLGCGGLYLIDMILSLFTETPVQLSICAGIFMKVKTVVDPVLLLTMPAIKKTRSASAFGARKFSALKNTLRRTTEGGTKSDSRTTDLETNHNVTSNASEDI